MPILKSTESGVEVIGRWDGFNMATCHVRSSTNTNRIRVVWYYSPLSNVPKFDTVEDIVFSVALCATSNTGIPRRKKVEYFVLYRRYHSV